MKNKFNRVISKIAGLTGRDKTAPARRALTAGLFVWAVLVGVFFGMRLVFALNAPPPVAGVGGGSLSTDSAQNLGLGATATTSAKLYVVPGINNAYGVKVDGKIYSTTGGFIFPDGTTQTTAGGGTTISAANVSSGAFGANTGGGNYSFPASVGIGTTNPLSRLQVQAASGVVSTAYFVTNDFVTGTNTGSSLMFDFGASSGNTYSRLSALSAGQSAWNNLVLQSGGGNVGIGTTGPRTTLDVNGASSFNNRLDLYPGGSAIRNGIIGSQGDIGSFGLTDSDLIVRATGRFAVGTNNANTARLVIDTAGNVGIGTTGPTSLLTLAQNSSINWINGNSYTWGIQKIVNDLAIKYGSGADPTTGDTAMYFQGSTGNVGIGTTGPTHKLEVVSATSGQGIQTEVSQAATGLHETLSLYQSAAGAVDRGPGMIFYNKDANGTKSELARIGGQPSVITAGAESGYLAFSTTNGGAVGEKVRITSAGNVGIGTTAPGYKLDVVSGGVTTARFGTASTDTVIVGGGVGKIDVGTVDPVYNINGVKYATYLPGMTGQKEETTGVIILGSSQVSGSCDAGKLNNGKIYCQTIDFANAQKGSDLWLFSKATNLKNTINNLTVLLTPAFEGKVWYKKDVKQNRLTIFALPVADSQDSQSMEISYRLTAPRFDADKWTNYYQNVSGNDITGFIIGD